jgi:ElaB/YqjD/DUF883 family membrane-anchored ribosome-binding protein
VKQVIEDMEVRVLNKDIQTLRTQLEEVMSKMAESEETVTKLREELDKQPHESNTRLNRDTKAV